MIDYNRLPGLKGIYLEDSYALEITESPSTVAFRIDAVLTPEHPAYRPPLQGEHYCFALASLIFPDATRVEWISRHDRQYRDATGERDLGSIDVLEVQDDLYAVEGDWGRIRIRASQPYVKLAG
ncbi:hypothetical protein [Mycolicibacterium sp. SCSIO 43805]|uniref:hypothetical protein n=1 Tax=Mycolicibacterium sp. SCSIO 43805 TaxID=3378074 RepID=UPI003AB5E1FD